MSVAILKISVLLLVTFLNVALACSHQRPFTWTIQSLSTSSFDSCSATFVLLIFTQESILFPSEDFHLPSQVRYGISALFLTPPPHVIYPNRFWFLKTNHVLLIVGNNIHNFLWRTNICSYYRWVIQRKSSASIPASSWERRSQSCVELILEETGFKPYNCNQNYQ